MRAKRNFPLSSCLEKKQHDSRMSETSTTSLKETLCAQQHLLQKLYNELDVEREASATAASEALSMILRLQGEKAAVKMEAEQYKRLAEEKMCYAEGSLALFEDLIYQKEMEVAALDYQVQAYRYKLLSMGCADPGLGEIKFPEDLLQRNETLLGDINGQGIPRRNSAPPVALKFPYLKRGIIERERSSSPEIEFIPKIVEQQRGEVRSCQNSDAEKSPDLSAGGDINTYWAQISRLDEKVKYIAGDHYANSQGRSASPSSFSHVSSEVSYDPIKDDTEQKEKFDQFKVPRYVMGNDVTSDSSYSTGVHDVFEVPQGQENLKGCKQQKNDEGNLVLQGHERFVKPDSVKSPVKGETDWVRKMLPSKNSENDLCRPSAGVAVNCHLASVHPTTRVVEALPKFQQLSSTLEIIEVGTQASQQEVSNSGKEEELKLLNEIREQLNTIQSEIRSWKVKKSPPKDDLPMLLLKEVVAFINHPQSLLSISTVFPI
ncbi:hypothetical protein RJ640_016180 [Escallonia rubra]|uniref:GTD-binding domain-containing protein n=1 Tax=Escallonia rubra TaxID=112253 RepID=A0AA88UDM5_9ASTE|nr:hypothetical protein RJ640_016180 [Escallonia rubra]